MAEEELKRKLAAILSADVKEYSRLMREDEAATVRTVTEYRQVMASLIDQHHGRVVDSVGDNLLAEFASVVDAVQDDEAMQAGLCASAHRGVDTTVIFPAKNDSWIVGAASRSFYGDLLAAGVRIFEYEGGLLHTKSLTLDGEVTLIGSANMDQRSLRLNFEFDLEVYDKGFCQELARHFEETRLQSRRITRADVENRSIVYRLRDGLCKLFSPFL